MAKGGESVNDYPSKKSAGSKRKKVSSGPSTKEYKEAVKPSPRLQAKEQGK